MAPRYELLHPVSILYARSDSHMDEHDLNCLSNRCTVLERVNFALAYCMVCNGL